MILFGIKNIYSTYEEAKQAAQKLKIKTRDEYNTRYSKDPRLPKSPDKIYYKTGWIEWYDFLKGKLPYKNIIQAKQAAKGLGIVSISDYRRRYSENPKLTLNPQIYYKKDWVSWGEFIGYTSYISYNEAKDVVKKLSIKTSPEYYKQYKRHSGLPSSPTTIYKDKWISWYEFLGRKAPNFYPTYKEFKQAVKKLKVTSQPEYYKQYKKDPRLMRKPYNIYKNTGWKTWYDLFDKKKPDFYSSYAKVKQAVKKLKFKTAYQYLRHYRKDAHLPSSPFKVYGMPVDWHDLLGKNKRSLYPSYKQAKQAVKRLGIKSDNEFRKLRKKDVRLPSNPCRFYKGWINSYDFFGKKAPSFYKTYSQAKRAVQRLKIKSEPRYRVEYRKDPKLPCQPYTIYSQSWTNWYDFLGKSRNHNISSKRH